MMENKTILLLGAGLIALLLLTSQSNDTSNPDLSVTVPKNTTPINKTVNITMTPNKCGYKYYGVPNYVGTEKENMTCKDAWPDQQNMECLLHPPANYDGTIVVIDRKSDPVLTCCVGDGTCQWLPKSK
jgi:hypothetical protein